MSAGRTPKLVGTVDYHAKREEIRAYFHGVFDKTEELFNLMTTDEAYYIKHEVLRPVENPPSATENLLEDVDGLRRPPPFYNPAVPSRCGLDAVALCFC